MSSVPAGVSWIAKMPIWQGDERSARASAEEKKSRTNLELFHARHLPPDYSHVGSASERGREEVSVRQPKGQQLDSRMIDKARSVAFLSLSASRRVSSTPLTAEAGARTNSVDDLVSIVIEEVVALGALVGSENTLVRLVARDDL